METGIMKRVYVHNTQVKQNHESADMKSEGNQKDNKNELQHSSWH